MTTLQDELRWEKRMIERGVQRYDAIKNKAIEGERVADTSAGNRLLKNYLQQIEDAMVDTIHSVKSGNVSNYIKVLRGMETSKIAFITLKSMMRCVYEPDKTLVSVCTDIGAKIEDEFHMMEIESKHKTYFDQAARQNKSTHYRHLRNSIIQAAKNNTSFQPNYWTQDQRAGVGLVLSQIVTANCDLFTKELAFKANQTGSWGKKTTFLRPTQECIDWVNKHDDIMRMLFPDRLPTLIKPADWTAFDEGGYWHPRMRRTTPFVIASKSSPHGAKERYESIHPNVYKAVNAMQATAWQINTRVLEVMKEVWTKNLAIGMPRSEPYEFPPCPLAPGATAETQEEIDKFEQWKQDMRSVHSKEAERNALCMLMVRNMRIAKELEDKPEFYYVYRTDFRGRVYAASSGVSPQGPDQSKALIQFAQAKRLGPRGLYWLKVHGANKWGTDKCSRAEQVAWIEERHEQWCAVANDPIGNRELWSEADKPYQFLAFCFEYQAASEVGEDFWSRLPIALDGSCNGLQHFSAMLRDAVGGSAVNLVPNDKPADIYQEVADVASNKLFALANSEDERAAGARNWLKLFYRLYDGKPAMNRKLTKKPVMTLPYGSTRQTCTESVYDWYRENGDDFFGTTGFRHSILLTPVLWESIGEVVIAARAAMSWIQKCAGIIGKTGVPLQYITPLGFPVHHIAYKSETKRVTTRLFGQIEIVVQRYTEDIDVARMRSGSSPNYVHSMDANHMMNVVLKSLEEGINSFAMIHDDFGTHACDIDKFHEIIRSTFVKQYSGNALMELKEMLEHTSGCELPDPPAMGDLNIKDIMNADHFFG